MPEQDLVDAGRAGRGDRVSSAFRPLPGTHDGPISDGTDPHRRWGERPDKGDGTPARQAGGHNYPPGSGRPKP